MNLCKERKLLMKQNRTHLFEDNSFQVNGFTRREIIILLIFSIAAITAFGMAFFPRTLEDAFITFRYSKHLAEGYGFGAWNTNGERVEGYTSFLWMLILAVTNRFGWDMRVTSKILGILSHVILSSIFIAFPLLRNSHGTNNNDLLGNPNEAVLTGVFLAFYLPISYYAASGMETLFFVALIALFIVSLNLANNKFLSPAIAILLVLTRPEGVFIVGMGILFLFTKRMINRDSFYPVYATGIATMTALVGLLLYRYIIFNDILPNTYWAKAAGDASMHIRWGNQYISDWTKTHIIIVFLCFVSIFLFFSSIKKWAGNLPVNFGYTLFLLPIFVLYIRRIGGDNYSAFPWWRQFVIISPMIALLACHAIIRIWSKSRFLQLLTLLSVVMITNHSLFEVNNHGENLKTTIIKSFQNPSIPTLASHNPYYLWLKNVSQSDTLIASSLGGELPFVVDAVHIDILGLNTPHIAKFGTFDPVGPQDSKTDMDWVMEQQPDIIEGYISAIKIIENAPVNTIPNRQWRYQMTFGLISSPVFQREYCFIRNGPYEYLDRALFFKISYWANNPGKDRLECIPVTQTVLGNINRASDEDIIHELLQRNTAGID